MSTQIVPVYMPPKDKKKINNKIWEALKPTYFDTIQLATCINILEEHGYTIIQEDYHKWDGIICGATGHENFEIATDEILVDNDGVVKFVKPVRNAQLSLSWHKMASGRYEVIAYVS